jgi:hypothetical protein
MTLPRRASFAARLCVLVVAACASGGGGPDASSRDEPPRASGSASRQIAPPAAKSTVGATSAAAAEAPVPRIGFDRALRLLFLDEPPRGAPGCRDKPDDVRCLLALRYAGDEAAAASALELFDVSGNVAGLNAPEDMDGGWRGQLRLVPELPVGTHRRHLAWQLAAARDIDGFFDGLEKRGGRRPRYRHQPIELRFFRTVGRTTPSAFANEWSIAFNVTGSINTSADAVRTATGPRRTSRPP